MRIDARLGHELRPLQVTKQYTKHAEGSVLIAYGDTKVLCTASFAPNIVPKFRKGSGAGWLTAEYSMLPRSTHERNEREAARGKQSGRTVEIQRIIGRALRNAIDLTVLGEHTITIDCDVLQADGGTRTAAITGGCIALHAALQKLVATKVLSKNPFVHHIAAVSIGILQQQILLDLDYKEDSKAAADMNVIMNSKNEIVEIQCSAEGRAITGTEFHSMLTVAQTAIKDIFIWQQGVCNIS